MPQGTTSAIQSASGLVHIGLWAALKVAIYFSMVGNMEVEVTVASKVIRISKGA